MKRDRANHWPTKWTPGERRGVPARTTHRDARIEVLVTAEEKAAIKALAKRKKRDVSTWIRSVLLREIASSVATAEAYK